MKNAYFVGLVGLFLAAAACDDTTPTAGRNGDALKADASACGDHVLGVTCKKPGGGCEAQVCVGTTWQCPDGDEDAPLVPGVCEVHDAGPVESGCSDEPPGMTCKKPGGGCEARICVGTTWQCPDGDKDVPVIPGVCEVDDAGPSGCGEPPLGVTCKKPGGGCEAQICVGTAWQCPDADDEAPVAPGVCDD